MSAAAAALPPQPVATGLDVDNMSRKELQAACKERGIKANSKTTVLREALRAAADLAETSGGKRRRASGMSETAASAAAAGSSKRRKEYDRATVELAAALRTSIVEHALALSADNPRSPMRLQEERKELFQRLKADPGACHLATDEHASPFTTACVYGECAFVQTMLDAGVDADFVDRISKRSALAEAALFECGRDASGAPGDIEDRSRVLGKNCSDVHGDECNAFCCYDDGGCILYDQAAGKEWCVDSLASRCSEAVVSEALKAAEEALTSCIDNLKYHRDDYNENQDSMQDVEVAEDRVETSMRIAEILDKALREKQQSCAKRSAVSLCMVLSRPECQVENPCPPATHLRIASFLRPLVPEEGLKHPNPAIEAARQCSAEDWEEEDEDG